MLAYTYISPGKFELVDKTKPELQSPRDVIVRISQNNAETHIKLNNQGIISALQRLIELSNNKNDIAKYQEKVAETHKELELIEASIRIYKNDVDAMTIEIKHLMDMLLVKAKELFDLSILLMKEKENMPAEKFL